MKKRFFLVAWILSGIGMATLGVAEVASAADQQPNFIIFIADDMAWDDCGAYGHPAIRTPNIDRLAADGLRFDRAFLTCSSCSPSRASILTGRYPHNTGAEQLHWPLPEGQVTFVQQLRQAGYYTAAAGKWHLGGPARSHFDRIHEGRSGVWQEVIAERPRDQPFFLWMAFFDPHRSYQKNTIPRPHTEADVQVPPYLPDTPEVRSDLALYYDEISRLDGVIGDVLTTLDQQGDAGDTFVLFMSDNGRPFPRCKTMLLDSGVRTPLILRFPGRAPAGETRDALVSAVDIAPTILELAGLTPGPTFQGRSMVPLLSTDGAAIRDYAYSEHHWHDYAAQERSVRSLRYRYIKNIYPQFARTPPADTVGSPTFQAMRTLRDAGRLTAAQSTVFTRPAPKEELYDLENDPDEVTNLATDPRHAATLAELRAALETWQSRTGDAYPREITPDEWDRETGRHLPGHEWKRSPRLETRAGTAESLAP